MAIIGNLLVKIGADTAGLQQGLGQAQTMVSGMGGKLGLLGSVGGAVATGGLALAAGAVAGIGAAAVGTSVSVLNMSSELDQAQRDMQAQLGLTSEEAAAMGEVVKGVYGNNFTDSIGEATAAVIEARQQMGDLSDKELQSATENALSMADAFGVDISESLNAAKVLTEEFGLSQEEAFDLMVGGFQRGLNSSGDFLGSISEYGNLFAENGLSAGQFFSAMETGLAGGVLGTDQIADAFKEAGILLLEGGDDVSAAFDLMGMDFERISGFIASGDEVWGDYMANILDGLRSIENPIERNKAGVAIFGTMWENMGASAMLGVDLTKTSMADLAGSTETLAAQYDTWGALFSGVWRRTLIALEPVGRKLLDLANRAMPAVEMAFAWFEEQLPPLVDQAIVVIDMLVAMFQDNVGPMSETWSETWATVQEATQQVIDFLSPYITGFLNYISEWWDAHGENVIQIAQAIYALIEMYIVMRLTQIQAFWDTWGSTILTIAKLYWDSIQVYIKAVLDIIGYAIDAAAALMRGDWEALGEALQNIWQTAWDAIAQILENGKKILIELLGKLKEELLKVWEDVKGKFSEVGQAIVDGIADGIRAGWNWLTDLVSDLANSLFKTAKDVLGIKSPSKVFMTVGHDIQAGLAKGLNDNSSAPVEAVRKTADRMVQNAFTQNIYTNNIGSTASEFNQMRALIST
ncbi:MAG: phage tail tape measure protein [Anaerolineae bacterium]|nr:phage tail tape measure protein [Anaerolineae bacterium]